MARILEHPQSGFDHDALRGHRRVNFASGRPAIGHTDGKVVGKAGLRAYFQRGLEAYPELHFQLTDVLCGVNSVVLYYTNKKGTRTAEFMELSDTGKVARVVANYGA